MRKQDRVENREGTSLAFPDHRADKIAETVNGGDRGLSEPGDEIARSKMRPMMLDMVQLPADCLGPDPFCLGDDRLDVANLSGVSQSVPDRSHVRTLQKRVQCLIDEMRLWISIHREMINLRKRDPRRCETVVN